MSSKGKRTNDLIEEYVTLIELADSRELNEPECARIRGIRAELRGLAGDGRACWDHDGAPIENGPGWTVVVSWATGDNEDRWHRELYQARAALALLAHGRISGKGMSADLTPDGAQFSSRAWIERDRG